MGYQQQSLSVQLMVLGSKAPVAPEVSIHGPEVLKAWKMLGYCDPHNYVSAAILSTWKRSTRDMYATHLRCVAQVGLASARGTWRWGVYWSQPAVRPTKTLPDGVGQILGLRGSAGQFSPPTPQLATSLSVGRADTAAEPHCRQVTMSWLLGPCDPKGHFPTS